MSQSQRDQPVDPSIDADSLLALRHEEEIAREQIKSLQQELLEKEQLVQKLEQELRHINNDLLTMNNELMMMFCSRPIPFYQAKEVAQTILKSQQSRSESLAQLLNAIYGSSIEAWELQQTPMPLLKSSPWTALEQFLPGHKNWEPMITAQSEELKTRIMTLRTQMARLKASSRQLKNITKFG